MKYLRTFLLTIQVNLQYRADIIIWFVCGIIPTVTLIFVWFSIMGNRATIEGFSKGDFIIYFMFQLVGWYIVAGTFSGPLGTRIKNGDVTKTLLKPYNLVAEMAIKEQAWKFTSILLTLPMTIALLFFFRSIIHVNFSFSQIIFTLLSLILGGLIYGLIESIVGCLAFWVSQTWSMEYFFDLLLSVFGGMLAPLTLMPSSLQTIAYYLPFKYIFYTPISIFLGKSSNPQIDIALQCLTVVIVYLIFKLVWNAGIKKYEAIGG